MTSSPSRVLPVRLVVLVVLVVLSTGSIAACAQQQPSAAEVNALAPEPATLEQLLAGRVAGVIVTRARGGGITVRIGGPNSFSMTEDPLFVVDGVPIEVGPSGTLSWLNPHDVESIAVLKYGADTAIYGVRGSNGVIIIKTKGSR